MKLYKYFSFFALMLLMACDTNDDGFYNETYVDIPNLVTIEAQPSYSTGDFIYVNADFSRYLTEAGEATPLDIYATTSGANEFYFNYILERQTGPDEWTIVPIATSSLAIEQGDAESESFVFAHAIYNPADQSYEYRVGLPLQTAGQYRLSFGYNSTSREVELRSKTVGNNLFLNISSDVVALNNEGYYLFSVQ